MAKNAPVKVQLNGADSSLGRDNVHAARNSQFRIYLNGLSTQILVHLIAIMHRLAPALPTSTLSTAREGTLRVQELMAGIHLPMRGFSASRNDSTRAA